LVSEMLGERVGQDRLGRTHSWIVEQFTPPSFWKGYIYSPLECLLITTCNRLKQTSGDDNGCSRIFVEGEGLEFAIEMARGTP